MSEKNLECEICHKHTPDVKLRLDPFMLEIYDKEIEMQICDACRQDRSDNI